MIAQFNRSQLRQVQLRLYFCFEIFFTELCRVFFLSFYLDLLGFFMRVLAMALKHLRTLTPLLRFNCQSKTFGKDSTKTILVPVKSYSAQHGGEDTGRGERKVQSYDMDARGQ